MDADRKEIPGQDSSGKKLNKYSAESTAHLLQRKCSICNKIRALYASCGHVPSALLSTTAKV